MKKRSFIICLTMALALLSFCPTNAQAKVVKKAGWYEAAAIKKDHSKYAYGVELKKFKLKGNKLITYGGFYYSNKSVWLKKLKQKKRVFRFASNCIYYSFNWKIKRYTTRKKLFKKIKSRMNARTTSEGLSLKVRNGKVVEVSLGQM